MKIYCRTRENRDILSKFVGKDFWILCDIWLNIGKRWSFNHQWVRVIADLGDSYRCKYISAFGDEDFKLFADKSSIGSDAGASVLKKNEIRVVQPVEILTTDDLFCLTREDIEQEASEED